MPKEKLLQAIKKAYPECNIEVTFKTKGKLIECTWPEKASKVLKTDPMDIMIKIMSMMEQGDKLEFKAPGFIYIGG